MQTVTGSPRFLRKLAKTLLGFFRDDYVWQLLEEFQSPEEMLRMTHCGQKPMNEVKEVIKEQGLSFGMEFPKGFVRQTS